MCIRDSGKIKHSLVYGAENGGNIGQNKALFKEFVKIGVFRGIFSKRVERFLYKREIGKSGKK